MKFYVPATRRERTHARVTPLLWRKVRHVYREYLHIIVGRYFVTSIFHTDKSAEIMSPRARPLRLFTALHPIHFANATNVKNVGIFQHIKFHLLNLSKSVVVTHDSMRETGGGGERSPYSDFIWSYYRHTTILLTSTRHLCYISLLFRIAFPCIRVTGVVISPCHLIPEMRAARDGKDCRSSSSRFIRKIKKKTAAPRQCSCRAASGSSPPVKTRSTPAPVLHTTRATCVA